MASQPVETSFPLISEARFRGFVSLSAGAGVVMKLYDQQGGKVGTAVMTPDELASFGRDCLGFAAAAKAADSHVVPLHTTSRLNSDPDAQLSTFTVRNAAGVSTIIRRAVPATIVEKPQTLSVVALGGGGVVAVIACLLAWSGLFAG